MNSKSLAAQIYDDAGASAAGVARLREILPALLGGPVEVINAAAIIAGELKARWLVIGGGADLPYCRRLNGAGNEQIRAFVAAGGGYLGICAGAYYASALVDFRGLNCRIFGRRELAFFPGRARGSLPELTGGRLYDEGDASRAEVELREFGAERFPYHGGCALLPPPDFAGQILGHYRANGLPAIVSGRLGAGRYLLSGVHWERRADAVAWGRALLARVD